MNRFIGVMAGLLMFSMVTSPASAVEKEEYAKLADEMKAHFDRHILAAWFPHCVDKDKGGFKASFDREWKPAEKQVRFLVFQARMTWVSAQVAMRRPELRDRYLQYARHGAVMLGRMEDQQHGGLYWGLDEEGRITPQFGERKHAYGISFGIYALAAAYEATKEPTTLDLAMRTFKWFDDHAHDNANGGYHEVLERDGTPVLPKDPGQTLPNNTPFPNRIAGYKSMNSHIHLLEAITQLYQVKKEDGLVRKRLEELLLVVRDKVAVEPGCLNLYFTPDWRAVPDHDSFGHDIETAFLLLEAAEALGKAHDPKTLLMARRLVDHALDWGYDTQRGGFYDRGAAFDRAHDLTKVWWTQAEGLNALLLMHELYGTQTDRYWKAFLQTWKFVNDHMVDQEKRGWYETVAADGKVEKATKASIWKAAYHDGRALMTMEQRLRKMAK